MEYINSASDASSHLFERKARQDAGMRSTWEWRRYADHAFGKLPGWLIPPAAGHVVPLSMNADEYNYMADDGHQNTDKWIDRAAQRQLPLRPWHSTSL